MIKYNRVKRNDKNKNSEYYFLSSREDEKLDEMKKDGSYDKIYEKWFGKRG